MTIQEKIYQAKAMVDEILYKRNIFFITEELPAKDGSYTAYAYIAAPNDNQRFGFMGYNIKDQRVEFFVLWTEMTRNKTLEGLPDPETYLSVPDENAFADYFAGVRLSKIVKITK